jgi:hypothetical protein
MLSLSVRVAILLAVVFALPLFAIRALPYHDLVNAALVFENCSPPCFLGIRPGVTTMPEAVSLIGAHDWVANGPDDFPSFIKDAIRHGAVIPRTVIEWRWNETVPEWIDGVQRGTVTVEDTDVLNVSIETRLSLGEIVLAFGDPDESWYIASNSANGRRFEYIAWYALERMLITTEGSCPMWHYYNYPVRILFRPEPPGTSESVSKASVCR